MQIRHIYLFAIYIVVMSSIPKFSHAQGVHWVSMDVRRHTSTVYADATFDTRIMDGNLAIWMKNPECSNSDVPCTAQFYRNAAIATVGTSGDNLDVIDNSSELTSAFGWAGLAKCVTAVDFCEGVYSTAWAGCSNGTTFVFEPQQDGLVIIHEFGHTVGLGHRDTCTDNLMYFANNGLNNVVNATECSALGGHAFTKYNGTQSGTLNTSSNPYWMNGNVIPVNGSTLTISPGVYLQVEPGATISGNGTGVILMNAGTSAIELIPTDSDWFHP